MKFTRTLSLDTGPACQQTVQNRKPQAPYISTYNRGQVAFTQFGHSVVLDVTSGLSVVGVGRVFTNGVKKSGEWYIIDRSARMCKTTFHPPEHAYEDDDLPVCN